MLDAPPGPPYGFDVSVGVGEPVDGAAAVVESMVVEVMEEEQETEKAIS